MFRKRGSDHENCTISPKTGSARQTSPRTSRTGIRQNKPRPNPRSLLGAGGWVGCKPARHRLARSRAPNPARPFFETGLHPVPSPLRKNALQSVQNKGLQKTSNKHPVLHQQPGHGQVACPKDTFVAACDASTIGYQSGRPLKVHILRRHGRTAIKAPTKRPLHDIS